VNLSKSNANLLFSEQTENNAAIGTEGTKKFGTFLGVYVPCILMLFGVIIFLRLGWIVGNAGLLESFFIITLSAAIALVATLSMSSIATNAEVGKGGIYYILSRTFGVEIGTAIGIPLFFRQSLSVAFCCIGFAESLHSLIPSLSITNIAVGTLIILTALAYTSIRGALKVQLGIFIVIIGSIISLFTGSELATVPSEMVAAAPLNSLGFWTIFTIFFPAMTGMESSVSLSGDLKNPGRSLPIGTISAIITSYVMYIAISIFLVYRVPIERLASDPLVIQDLASIPALIIVGIWGATLSSALGDLLAAPRTLQAIAEDGMAPKIFAKGFGPLAEPRVATMATFLIALFGACYGSVNILAPLLTMVSLISYCVLNFSAGMETVMANPSWRPRFHVHWAISLGGSLLCLVTMLMVDVGTALMAILGIVALYVLAKRRKIESTLSDIRDGILRFFSRSAIYRLTDEMGASKSWRPHFLVFTDSSDDLSLVRFAQGISQSKGFVTMASFVTPGSACKEVAESLSAKCRQEKIEALVEVKEAPRADMGMHQMIEHYGLGPLTPDTIVFGGISRRQTNPLNLDSENQSIDFARMIDIAHKRYKNVVILTKAHKLKDFAGNNIHIWWDDSSQANFELMLVIGYMLHLNRSKKGNRLYIKATASNEMDQENKRKKLEQIGVEKRLPIDIEVFVSDEKPVEQFSKEADMIFLGLQPPGEGNELAPYNAYLQDLAMKYKDLPVAFVLSSKTTPLSKILE
jgi:potassium/chloride transporter 4/5/6